MAHNDRFAFLLTGADDVDDPPSETVKRSCWRMYSAQDWTMKDSMKRYSDPACLKVPTEGAVAHPYRLQRAHGGKEGVEMVRVDGVFGNDEIGPVDVGFHFSGKLGPVLGWCEGPPRAAPTGSSGGNEESAAVAREVKTRVSVIPIQDARNPQRALPMAKGPKKDEHENGHDAAPHPGGDDGEDGRVVRWI
jgi:hypothetical protein